MIPKPPSWIRPRMLACPNPDQYVGVSTTVNPVTQTAEVAVNSAVRKGAEAPLPAREIGSHSSSVPIAIASANATATSRAG
jgi:hypothetical protein